jgi:kynureninase
MSAHKASLDIFTEAGMHNLVAKGKMLSSYLLFILNEINHLTNHNIIEIITPLDEKERGCQVSMLMLEDGKRIFDELIKAGIIADWREPNVIRVAPVPLYNSFEDVFNFGKVIQQSLMK